MYERLSLFQVKLVFRFAFAQQAINFAGQFAFKTLHHFKFIGV